MITDKYGSHFSWFGSQIEPEIIPENERPTFNDIQEHSEAGIIKRGISRYLFTKNPERSIKTHKFLGAPILRKVIMGTYGRFFPRSAGSNYRTDKNKSLIEGSMRFAVGGSVFNELWHLGFGVISLPGAVESLADGHYANTGVIATALNFSLVSLQRYNRARMIQRIDNELSEGRTFDPNYSNWLGIDADAVESYRDSIREQNIGIEQSISSSSQEPICLSELTYDHQLQNN